MKLWTSQFSVNNPAQRENISARSRTPSPNTICTARVPLMSRNTRYSINETMRISSTSHKRMSLIASNIKLRLLQSAHFV